MPPPNKRSKGRAKSGAPLRPTLAITRMNREGISTIVETVPDLLIAERPALLDLDFTERARSHHLARYISALVPTGRNVDVE